MKTLNRNLHTFVPAYVQINPTMDYSGLYNHVNIHHGLYIMWSHFLAETHKPDVLAAGALHLWELNFWGEHKFV